MQNNDIFQVQEIKATAIVLKNMESTAQCQWSQKLRLAQVKRTNKQMADRMYIRWRLISRLHFNDILTESIMLKALKVQIKHCSPYIQIYYSIFRTEKTLNHRLEAELYRYTLSDVLKVCKEHELRLPEVAGQYIIFCFLQIYKFLLYLITETETSLIQGIVYDPSIQNLGFNFDYRLILLNPCHSKGAHWRSILVREDIIGNQFRITLIKNLEQCSRYFTEGWKGKSLLDFLKQSAENDCFKIEEQRQFINVFQLNICGENTEIPHQFFMFLKEHIESRIENPIKQIIQQYELNRRNNLLELAQRNRNP